MEYKTLGELCDVVSGGTPSRSKQDYWNGDIPWIKIGNIKSRYISEADEFITEAGLSESSAKILKKWTILYTIFATLGEVGVLTIDACTNQAIAGITIKDESIIDRDYLFYFLKSKKNYVNEVGRGVAQNNINMSILRGFEVPLRNLHEQQEITEVLDKTSLIIEARRRELEKLDTLIKARFVEMFGDPETNPNGWEQVSVGDVCSSIVRGPFGSALKKEFFVEPSDTAYKVYEQKHAIQKSATIGTYYVTEEKFKELKRFECVPGDILMSCSGTMGELFQLPNDCERGIINQALCKFTLNEKMLPICFLTYMRQTIGNLETKGSGIKNIAAVSYVKAMPINLPPMEVQFEFENFCKQVDKSKFVVQKALDEAQILFDSLMQEYFG